MSPGVSSERCDLKITWYLHTHIHTLVLVALPLPFNRKLRIILIKPIQYSTTLQPFCHSTSPSKHSIVSDAAVLLDVIHMNLPTPQKLR
jgi:hypothetical protein